jgi:hypothetical protein
MRTHQLSKSKKINLRFEHGVAPVSIEIRRDERAMLLPINDRKFQMLARQRSGICDLSYTSDVEPIQPSFNWRGMHSIARSER